MSFAIMRIQKVKSVGGLGRHLDRSDNGNISVPDNADYNNSNSNLHWDKDGNCYSQKEWAQFTKVNSLSNRINDEIRQRYRLTKRIRKDAVRAIEYIMTSDHMKMREIFSDDKIYRSWIKDNQQFLSKIYGEDNILSMHLHMDEKTPHLHIVVTPITSDGRLSAKSFVDGRKALADQQTLYAEIMKKYGMERGIKGSTARHQKVISNYNDKISWER